MSGAGKFRCDLFCRVVDNFGDAGVCWRLARQLAEEFPAEVRLIIDDRRPLQWLVSEPQAVEVVDWQEGLEPADLVIEAFACELPQTYVEAMAERTRPSIWLNLEYLSAEAWVGGHHLLASPHPRLPLTKYFFFPGFAADTGGLLRERGYCLPDPPPGGESLKIFLFAYANRALPALFDVWQDGPRPAQATLPGAGEAVTSAQAWKEGQAGAEEGSLSLRFEPFRPQNQFDAWLAGHEVLFVRGEDSFVRAQWAARPFVWHIYPQEGGAHWTKLEAFLDRYCEDLPAAPEAALRGLWTAWNAEDAATIGGAWQAFTAELPALSQHARVWAEKMLQMPDLATNLVTFYRSKAII